MASIMATSILAMLPPVIVVVAMQSFCKGPLRLKSEIYVYGCIRRYSKDLSGWVSRN